MSAKRSSPTSADTQEVNVDQKQNSITRRNSIRDNKSSGNRNSISSRKNSTAKKPSLRRNSALGFVDEMPESPNIDSFDSEKAQEAIIKV